MIAFRRLSSGSVMLSCLAAALCCCSCQQYVLKANSSTGSVGTRTYADAVVHINQVDPAYRPYFQAQHAPNYSLNEQRKAYIAATQTARTPVRESDYRPGDIRSKKKQAVAAKRGKSSAGLAAKGKASASKNKRSAVAVKTTKKR